MPNRWGIQEPAGTNSRSTVGTATHAWTLPCEVCGGNRFCDSVLHYTLRGRIIADVLNLSIREAADFFTEPTVQPMLRYLVDAGIGYVALGQPLTTLSGGERQRLRLGIEMEQSQASPYILDEPSRGCTWPTWPI